MHGRTTRQQIKKVQPNYFGALKVKELRAIYKLQKKLMSSSVLALPNAKEKNMLDTNACNVQIECFLLQEQQDGTTKPVEYWSQLLAKAEKVYDTTQRGCHAIVGSIPMLRQ